jgi:prepilin-type N-terminal cleavage/methylation domain-containing protein/prepilin-type processing-associated H-X9-DG protein
MHLGRAKRRGFTLIELLVVIGVIVAIAGLLLPSLTRAKSKATAAQCISNFRQMQVSWHLYLSDHRDFIVPNFPFFVRDSSSQYLPTWAGGNISYGEPESTNILMLMGGDPRQPKVGLLGKYVGSHKVFRCPADRSTSLLDNGRRYPRARSCAMNGYIGNPLWDRDPLQQFPREVMTLDQLSQIGRSEVIVWYDIHEDFLRSCAVVLPEVDGLRNPYIMEGVPGSRHLQAGTVSFVDGHVEIHRWKDPATRPPVQGVLKGGINTGLSADWIWLRSRMIRAKTDRW